MADRPTVLQVVNEGDGESRSIEVMDISSTCEIEIAQTDEIETSNVTISPTPYYAPSIINISTEDQQLLNDEIKEEEIEDADVSQDISQQGKRLLLKDWLIQKLDSQEMPDILSWYNKVERLFRIKWLHKATDSWEVMADGVLFKEWCIHTGRYDPTNENPRKWKANFRCALNSLPDVIIVPTLCVRKGKDAYRVFKILPEKIPEKVREKQESSRKRRREKRENLLKAFAKDQAEKGNVEQAVALSKQIALNPSNIKIHLKRAGSTLVNPITMAKKGIKTVTVSGAIAKATKAKASATTGSGKTLLNGMDALCTAAAMMADTPEGEQAEEAGDQTEEAPMTTANTAVSIATASGDVMTYYRPIGPLQVSSPVAKPSVAVAAHSPVVTAPPQTLPVFKPLNPVKLGSAAITTSTGNVLLSVRLAQSSSVATPVSPAVVQGIQSQLPGFPHGVCIQPFPPAATLADQAQPATYLIPKTFLQQQIAASAGNQPARVFTVKPAAIPAPEKAPLTRIRLSSLPDSTPINVTSNARILPSETVDYARLKESISKMLDMESNGLQFQLCKNSKLIKAVRMYDSEKPNVEVSITIATDFSFNMVVHNRLVPPNSHDLKKDTKTIKTQQQFKHFLERVNGYVTCIGNPEEMAHNQYTDYSSFISAYQEPDFGAENALLRYHSTIRSNYCHMLIKSPGDVSTLAEDVAKESYRCDECSRIRVHVLSMRGLFSLLDGSKVADTEAARRKRLKLLKDLTTKEVLANRVDVLETQLKRYQQLLPKDILESVERVTNLTDFTSSGSMSVSQSVSGSTEDTTEYVTSIAESVDSPDGGVGNVINVTLAHNSHRLATETVYHIVDNGANSSDIMLVTEDDLPTTERLLEELTNSALDNT